MTPRERTVTSGLRKQLQALGFEIAVQEKIEAAHFVGTIVRAVAGADAAVVDHVVQPLIAVRRRTHGTNQLAGRVLALHAWHRLMIHLGIVQLAFVIAIDANPVHLPAAQHFVLTHHRTVIFGLARDDAGVAADAGVDVDGHAPGVAFIFEAWIELRLAFLRVLPSPERSSDFCGYSSRVPARTRSRPSIR